MNAALLEAWKVCDLYSVIYILDKINVMEHTYVLRPGRSHDFCNVKPCIEQFALAAERQNIPLIPLQQILVHCISLYQYYGGHSEMLNDMERKIRLFYRRRQRVCRAALLAVLGCVGKPRRVHGGTLRDVMRAEMRRVWRETRRSGVWDV